MVLALVIVGCGSSAPDHGTAAAASVAAESPTATEQAHPQVVEPAAGEGGAIQTIAQAAPPKSGGASGKDPAPTAPATITLAPAKGAPTDAEVRAAVARFQAAVAEYHLNRLNLSGALLNPAQLPPGQYNVSIASVYTDYGLPVACGGVLHVPELGVANKTLPCGTEVIFVYDGRAVRVPVIDRGPYIAGREWDLTGATAEALHFPGLGPIEWRLG